MIHVGDTQRGMFSTSGDIMIHVGGYHEYIGDVQYIRGISSVHWGDIMSTTGDVQYIRGSSVHRSFQ